MRKLKEDWEIKKKLINRFAWHNKHSLQKQPSFFAPGPSGVSREGNETLPGLIGAIVSFLFKKAGQMVSYLAEHTWLLILAVVAFLVKKYI